MEWLGGLVNVNPSSHSPFYFVVTVIGFLASPFPGAADISDKVLILLGFRTRGTYLKPEYTAFGIL